MLLSGARLEIFRPQQNHRFTRLHMIAHLHEDIAHALPYLNASLGGDTYIKEPPSVTFQVHGRLITVHADKIAANSLVDEAEAEKILNWMIREINQAWENRDNLTPCYESAPRPQLLEVLKLLPKTNCAKCGQPTCMVFAAKVVEGAFGAGDCPELDEAAGQELAGYLGGFKALNPDW